MMLLDTDKDGLVGFFDFLQPIMHIVPPEVMTTFTQDQRFKQGNFNDLRVAYDGCKQTNEEGGSAEANVDLLRSKLVEKGVEQNR